MSFRSPPAWRGVSEDEFMLKWISPLITPELLAAMSAMGHGDGIVIADANFPARRVAGEHTLVQLPMIGTVAVLKAIMKLIPPDALHENPGYVMRMDPRDQERLGTDPLIWKDYLSIVSQEHKGKSLGTIERMAFYEEASRCRAVVLTGEMTPYANIIVYKGVIENKTW